MANEAMPKLSGQLGALWRQGLKDLQAAVLGEWGGQTQEMGVPGSPTSQMVTESLEQTQPEQRRQPEMEI